ncbi:MAG: class III extradiol ring-cleavage dioxygenase [Polyangiaceae bacterium]
MPSLMSRRAFSLALVGAAAACRSAENEASVDPKAPTTPKPNGTMPVLFLAHGAPTLALDAEKGAPFAAWGRALPQPRALLVLSAHWTISGPTLGTTTSKQLVYDFYGFPEELYRVRYAAPGAPDAARRVAELFGSGGLPRDESRGLDHGVWVPLVHMFPKADVPVLQLSLPIEESPSALFELGKRLAPLRREGILIAGSGNLTHNLRRIDPRATHPAPWAEEFDKWCEETLNKADVDALVQFRTRAPAVRENHPTDEHFLPLLVAAGAAAGEKARFPVEGFEYGNLSRRSVQLG